MPNLIHSLDAASLSLLIDKYFNNNKNNIFAIHDCFATTCNNMQFVIDSLKEVYISIYSEKVYIKELDENMRNHIKTTIDDNFSVTKTDKKIKSKSKKNNEANSKNVFTLIKNNKVIELVYPDISEILDNKYDISDYIKNSSYIIN
jgi:DNA-directed RNA polymerase